MEGCGQSALLILGSRVSTRMIVLSPTHLRGDTALNRVASLGDGLLSEAKLWKGSARGDLNLCSHDIDACDLLGDGVLDLDTRVDFDEVVSVLLVDEELCGTGVPVLDRFGDLLCVLEDLESDLIIEHGRGLFDDLLVSSLDRTVTLEEVDAVALSVTQQLDFDVAGSVEESLDEDRSVAEGRLGLGNGSLEPFLEVLLLAYDSHATSTAAHGGLDDDGKAILLDERVGEVVRLDGTVGTWDDRHLGLDGCSKIGRWGGRTDASAVSAIPSYLSDDA